MDIILRTCAPVNVVSGGERLGGISKRDLIAASAYSLFRSAAELEQPPRITIVDDHSSPELVGQLIGYGVQLSLNPVLVPLEDTGNAASLRRCYELARDCEGLVYLVEDDYLHLPSALPEMLDLYQRYHEQTGGMVVHPCDYPDRYQQPYPSHILLGCHRHWRTVLHTTGTFLLHRDTLRAHWDHYMKFTEYGITPGVCEDNTINQVYREVPCFSPMPSLALHYQYQQTISPYCDATHWLHQCQPTQTA